MRRVGVKARVPEQRHGDLGHRERQRENVHAGARRRGVALGHGGDQVGGARQSQGRGKAADGGGDVAPDPRRLQGTI